jgi:phage terminase Nu1 subunit (DNA packaging protein)
MVQAGRRIAHAQAEGLLRGRFAHLRARVLEIPEALRRRHPDLAPDDVAALDQVLREGLAEVEAAWRDDPGNAEP